LGTARADEAAGTLLSFKPTSVTTEPVARALEWARALVDAGPDDQNGELIRALAQACSFAGAWLAPVDEARSIPAGQLALERGAAVISRCNEVPGPVAAALPHSVWLLAAPDAGPDPEWVVFMARPMSLRFSAAEVARVTALLAIRRGIARILEVQTPKPKRLAS
jgi:hypothetical protein